ncbi:MAG: VWA domain-containing protein [Gammaproteobacteria bacterium]|nr:VWA domain-containing protein [Gammaproteobacteria bacterium]
MFALDWWWAMLLLPLPVVARRLLAKGEVSQPAVSVPLLNRYGISIAKAGYGSKRFGGLALWLFWIALIIAASRPFWLDDPISRSLSGRDLMLAVDISGSMSETDMMIDSKPASRLDVLKVVVEKFIQRRQGDRLGLILFGSKAYNYVPLTFDLETLKKLLLDVSTGLAGRHTAIGDAIGIAIKSMREQAAEHRVLILITDGSNTSGFENPVLAAAAAARQGMTIYTIGVGSDIESLNRTYGVQNVPAGIAMDEKVLQQIASLTGGKYFRATSSNRLQQIYRALDQLEPVEHEYQTHRPRHELFAWPLSIALLIMIGLVVSILRQSLTSRG